MAETAERHLTEEDLASIATGQAPGAEAVAHLRTCADCRQDLALTERVASALAEPITLHEPPAGVWAGIDRELGLRGDHDGAPVPEGDGTVTFLPRTQRRRWPVIAAAAAAGLVVGVTGAAVVAGLLAPRDGERETPPRPVAVGEAVLAPVTDRDVEGRAEMVAEPDGGLRLTVDVTQLPEQGYYEVWLRDEQASRLISLGTVSGRSTTLPVPSGVDLDRFPVVDVSQEDFDGNPAHSGVTLAAGAMTRTGDTGTAPQ
ncbi:MAG: anti-sigma factor [Micrococcus sp.]|nr:anti-sigma factor [Micrococcus sp.]